MLTPKFSLSQDASYLFIHMHVPFIKLPEADCYVVDDEFYFYAQPYYLRLHLPGEVVDDEHSASQSQYDIDSGQLIVRLSKKVHGEWFEGLDMLTKLLTPKTRLATSEGIEVISDRVSSEQEGVACNAYNQNNDTNTEFDFDWFVDQQVYQEETQLKLEGPKYGFAKRKSNVLKDISSVVTSMIDLKNPDIVPEGERRFLRQHQEVEAFNCEHYLADYFDDESVQETISFQFDDLVNKHIKLSQKEQDQLIALPNRKYIIDKLELKSVYLGLVDLIYAYSFNYRFTNGTENVESDWTICKLSATLSWLDYFSKIKDVVISCARRSLCFPLFRNWELFQRVLEDVKLIFKNGKTNILKCLLGIHSILSKSEAHYPLNDLYITDYCVWVQCADSKQIQSISDSLEQLHISKSDVEFNLDAMESEARELMLSEHDDDHSEEKTSEVDKLSSALSNVVHIKETACSDTDSDDDDEGSDESEETSSSGSDTSSEEDNTSEVKSEE